ncbi:MAG TPA: trypsin-like serine protease [Chloroflexota bacterium]
MQQEEKRPDLANPLSDEDTLRLREECDSVLPEDIQRELTTPRVYLHGVAHRAQIDDHLSAVEEIEDTWSIRLPEGAGLGLPGRSAERLDRATVAIPEGHSTAPHKPEWSGIAYRPRVAQEFHHGMLRTTKGRVIEPYYGIYDNPDARKVYWPSQYPWRCTGRIFTYTTWPTSSWAWSGSGVLIGPRLVLTAGHVAPWGKSPWAMLFVPGYWDGASIFGAGASSYVSDYRGWNTGGATAYDICLLRLYNPLGNSLGWIGSRTYDGAWEGGNYWVLTGYPGAIAGANRPVYQSGVPVLDDDEDGDAQQLEHHGDSSPGESGGPMFGFWNDGPHAIGTTSGGETISGGFLGIGNEDNNIAAGGSAMVDLVKWGLSNWP